jgi:hypothetical protein
LDCLKPHLLEVIDRKAWPGTVLTHSAAPVYWYRVTPELANQLKATVRSIYAWAIPDLPEDLAFYWPDGSTLLGTSSHEQFAFLNLSDEEVDEFRHEVPDVHLEERPDG